jgi:hypothetical protein
VSFNINSIKEIVISLMKTEKCAELKEKVKKAACVAKKKLLRLCLHWQLLRPKKNQSKMGLMIMLNAEAYDRSYGPNRY